MNKRDEYAVKNENLIGTEGGTYVNGDVIPDGDFVGRDKTIINNYLFKFSSRVVGYAMSIIIVVGLTIYWVWLPSLNTPKLIQAVSQNQSISQFEQDLVVTSSLDTEKIWLSSFPILPDRKRIVSSGATGPADFDRIVYDNFEGLVNFTVHNIGESTLLIDAVQLEVINISPMKFNAVEIPTSVWYMNSRQKPYTYTVSIDAKNSDDKLLVTGQDKYDAQPNEIQTFQIWVDTKTEGFKYEFDICIYWYDNKFSDERQRNCLDKHYVIEYPKLEMTFREVIRKASQIDCFLYDPAPIALITVISDLNPSASIRYIMPPSWENRIQSNDLSDFRVNFSESQKSPPYIVIDNSKLILILSPGFGITTSSEQEIVRQYVEKFNKVYLTAQKAHIDKFTEGQESLHLDKLEKGAIEEFAEPVGVSPNITSQIDISDGTVIFQLTPDMWIFSTEITK